MYNLVIIFYMYRSLSYNENNNINNLLIHQLSISRDTYLENKQNNFICFGIIHNFAINFLYKTLTKIVLIIHKIDLYT